MRYLVTVLLIILGLYTQAQTISWDGGAGTNNWEDADNWSGNVLPSILKDVVIDNDSVSVNANTTVKSITLKSTHPFDDNQAIFVQNGVTLSVFNGDNNGIELDNNSRLWNAGRVIVGGADVGIYLKTSSLFENMLGQGFLNISYCLSGMINYGTFQNRFNSIFEIQNSSAGLINENQLSNRGTITISDVDEAIVNNDVILNRGEINCLRTANEGISTADYFKNFDNGTVNIDSCAIGIKAINDFINEGSISINQATDDGLIDGFGPLDFTNSGTVAISNGDKSGIVIDRYGGSFINEIGGEIHVDTTANYGILSLYDITNNGDLYTNKTTSFGLYISGDSLLNNGLIEIKNVETIAINFSGTIFLNSLTGIVKTDSTLGSGLRVSGNLLNQGNISVGNAGSGLSVLGDTLINQGLIKVQDTYGGIVINDGSFLENESSGELLLDGIGAPNGLDVIGKFFNEGSVTIKNTDGNGLGISEDNPDSLVNGGLITIQNAGAAGIENLGLFFINESSGLILIDTTDDTGIYTEGMFINEGIVHIKNADDEGLINTDTLINNSCSKMMVEGLVSNFSQIHNKGLMIQNYLQNEDDGGSLSGGVLNDGTFINLQLPQELDSEFINNGNIIHPLRGDLSNGIKEMNVATTGGSALHAIPLTWWADEAKTTTAGSYDNVDKTFTPNADGVLSDTLWLELNDGACSIMACIPVNQMVNCQGAYLTTTFTGALSSDWHTPGNWDTGIVPDACTIVTIPASLSCTITTGRKARAYRMEVASGSVFDAELGVVLDINPEN